MIRFASLHRFAVVTEIPGSLGRIDIPGREVDIHGCISLGGVYLDARPASRLLVGSTACQCENKEGEYKAVR